MFCPGYLELWLDSTLHLVLFIQYILNSVSVAFWEVVNLSERWLFLTSADQCGQNTAIHIITISSHYFQTKTTIMWIIRTIIHTSFLPLGIHCTPTSLSCVTSRLAAEYGQVNITTSSPLHRTFVIWTGTSLVGYNVLALKASEPVY